MLVVATFDEICDASVTYPEPVARCCGSLTETASVVVEDLTVDDPGCTVPRRCVENGPQVEEEDRGNTARGQRGGGVRINTSVENVTTNDPHANRAADGTDHQELSASKVVDENQDPDNGEDGLDHTEDTGGQEGGAGSADTDRGEDLSQQLALVFTIIRLHFQLTLGE